MKEAVKEYTDNLWKEAKLNKELADEAYEKGDLSLSAFHKGTVSTYEGIAAGLDDILAESVKIYIVWASERYEESFIDKIFFNENKAKEYIENRDKMTGMYYSIQETEVEGEE